MGDPLRRATGDLLPQDVEDRFAIDWQPRAAKEFDCPVCRASGSKGFVLAVPSPLASHALLGLYACAGCGCLSFPGLETPDYAAPSGPHRVTQAAIKFYIEQGAAPDVMVEPLFWPERGSIHRYAEVGCGFGFGLDFAREALGWSVQGYDPSPAAVAGREQLGLPITADYLGPASLRGVPSYDLVLASEVIEHISDPHAFVATLASAIAPSGWLVLTTPNAAGISPGATPATLLTLLSPGYHLVLFSATGLTRLLQEHGFQHHYLRVTSTTLTVLASRHPFTADPNAVLDRVLYREYLQARLATLDPDLPLAHGFAGRLFKEQVNAGEYQQALGTFSKLAASIRNRYGLDLGRPDQPGGGISRPEGFSRFAFRFPLNLCGLAYRRGFLALHHEQQADNARRYFTLGEVAGLALRQALRSIGCDDGETEDLVERCRLGRLEAAVAAGDRPRVRAWFGRRLDGSPPDAWHEECSRVIRDCFTDRVLAGDLGMAELMVQSLSWTTPKDPPPMDLDGLDAGRFLLARGLYALNREGDAFAALDWLSLGREKIEKMQAQEDKIAGELSRTLLRAQLYAQASARPAEALMNPLLWAAQVQDSFHAHSDLGAEVFQRLVHAGAYQEAEQLESPLLARLATAPARLTDKLAFTLGVLALNKKGDYAAAHGWFIQAMRLATPGSELAYQARQLAERTVSDGATLGSGVTPNVTPSED